jgi:hypothetical protein
MPKPVVAAFALLVLLAGCTDAPEIPGNDAVAANAADPAAARLPDNAPLGAGGLAAWLVGTWSFEAECATDFAVHYNADGSVENSGEGGRWKLDGDTITETITERFEMGGDEPQKVEPAEVRSYKVERVGQNRGVVTSPFNGNKVPILRC